LFIIDIWLWIGLGFATWLSLRREKRGLEWRRPARIALSVGAAYIELNAGITRAAEQGLLMHAPYPAIAIGNPTPATFWLREPITGNGDGFWTVDGQQFGDVALADCDL